MANFRIKGIDDERPAEAIIPECSPRSRKSAHHAKTTTGKIT